MKLFRKTDGYTELTASPEGDLVELFVTAPGDEGRVVHAHFSSKLAYRLALWLLMYWARDRWFGLRTWLEQRKQRRRLFEESLKETGQ